MKWNSQNKVIPGFLIAILFFVTIGIYSYRSISNLITVNNSVNHTYQILQNLENIFSLLKDIEAETRSYLLVGEEKYLEPYDLTLETMHSKIKVTRESTSDNPFQQINFALLEPLIEKRVAYSKQLIQLYRAGKITPAIASPIMSEAKEVMDSIRELIAQMQGVEKSLLEERERREKTTSSLVKKMIVLGNFTALFLMIFMIFILYRRIARERKAEEKNRQLATLVEFSEDAIIGKTLEGVITSWNKGAEKMYGYKAEEVISKPISLLFPPEIKNEFFHILKKLNQGESIRNYETTRIKKDGNSIPVSLAVSPIRDMSGKLIGAATIARDITEKYKIDQMKNEFISTVSHELRTPLTSIRGSLGLIAGGMAGKISDQAKKLLEIGINNCERLIQLINDILDIEKIEFGKVELKIEPIELVSLLNRCIAASQIYAEQYKIKFVLEKKISEVKVFTDPTRLMQVIIHLLSNAAKFSPLEGIVKIKIDQHLLNIRVSISDNGSGIPEDFQNKIFQKFAQADSSDSRKKGGTGLGLSICKALIEKMGGKINFETSSNGTTFYFDLKEVK